MKHALIAFLTLLPIPSRLLLAEEPKPIAYWVESIREEARTEQLDEHMQRLRLGAGVYITHRYGGGDELNHYHFPDAVTALGQFMTGRGATMMRKLVSGEPPGEDERKAWPIVSALFLWAGHNQAARKPGTRVFELPLDEAALARAKQEHARVIERGQAALQRGYRTGLLTGDDITAIRLYRVVEGMRGVGECFLASHLGLHPLRPAAKPLRAGHGIGPIARESIGRSFFDARLPRLETVRARPSFTDLPNYRYGYEVPLRPEGVLEFIEPMLGYVPDQQAVRSRHSGGPLPNGYEEIGTLVGEKPLLLYSNDGVDQPLLRAFGLVPVLMRAWSEHADWRFVVVNIHDWHYAASHYNDYLSRDNWRVQHHAWSEEERARRLSMRLVQCPHVEAPVLVDTWAHIFKDRYASGGGQNSFILIGTDGVIAHRNGGAFRPLNEVNAMEHALSQLIASGGRGVLPREAAQRTLQPQRPVAVVHGGVIAALDANDRRMSARFSGGDGNEWSVVCPLASYVRIRLDGQIVTADRLQPGDRIQVRCFLDALGAVASGHLPPARKPWEKTGEAKLHVGGHNVTVRRVQDGYAADYDLFVIIHSDRDITVQPREIRAWRRQPFPGELANRQTLWPRRVVIWRGGKIISINSQTRTVQIAPWKHEGTTPSGLRIVQDYQAKGTHLFLDDIAKQRLACVERWRKAPDALQILRLDDAVDYTLNGHMDATFHDLRPGDAVTWRYECRYDGAEEIRPEMVRISRASSSSKTGTAP
jgi:hypothetical protein